MLIRLQETCAKRRSILMTRRRKHLRVMFFGDDPIKDVKPIFEASGCTCYEYKSTNDSPFLKIRELIKLLLARYIYIVSGSDVQMTTAYKLALKLKKTVIVHWIGTDVQRIRDDYNRNPRRINNNCVNLAVAPWLVNELKEVEIEALEVPIVPYDVSFSLMPMPKVHAVIVYAPQHRERFYGIETIKKLAAMFPDIDFHVVANDGNSDENKLPNMKYEGSLERNEMYSLMARCTIHIRCAQHDGLPMTLLEALGMGRRVIFNHEFPYVDTPSSSKIEDIAEVLGSIISEEPKINAEAVDFISQNYSMDKRVDWYVTAGLL